MERRFVTLEEFRDRIKERRKTLGYSLQDMGSRVGIDRNTIKLMEDGKINDPGLSKALKILSELGLDASALMISPDESSQIERIILLIQEETLFSERQKRVLVDLIEHMAGKRMKKIRRILIVDDQEIFLRGARGLFEKHGYEVKTAQSFTDAIEKLSTGIDLALIDIDLKEEKSGIDILNYIQKERLNVPGIMLSGLRNQYLARKAMEAGAFDYIDKEEDMEKIFLIIRRIEEFNNLQDSYNFIETLISV